MSALRKVPYLQVVPKDDFELTNCPDPKCFICVTMPKGGYPSASQIEDGRIKLNPHHKKKLKDSMIVLLDFIGRADVDGM